MTMKNNTKKGDPMNGRMFVPDYPAAVKANLASFEVLVGVSPEDGSNKLSYRPDKVHNRADIRNSATTRKELAKYYGDAWDAFIQKHPVVAKDLNLI